jgi:urease beta subunit
MTTTAQVINWSAPPPVASVVPDEAFDVGEPSRIGAIDFGEGPIEINAGRETKQIEIVNTGDRPIQVGAHYHLFEVNRAWRSTGRLRSDSASTFRVVPQSASSQAKAARFKSRALAGPRCPGE